VLSGAGSGASAAIGVHQRRVERCSAVRMRMRLTRCRTVSYRTVSSLNVSHSPLNVSQTGRIGGDIGENHALLVVVAAQDPVLRQVESITHAESLVTLLTGETVEVVDVALGPHHHLEGRDHFAAGGAIARRSEQSEIIAFAENEIGAGVERGTDFAQSTVAASAFQTIFVPVNVQSLEQVLVGYGLTTSRTGKRRR